MNHIKTVMQNYLHHIENKNVKSNSIIELDQTELEVILNEILRIIKLFNFI